MTYEIKYRKDHEMKDSGVEWLGKVPESFKLKSLKHSYKFTTGSTPSSGDASYYSEDGYKWLTISDIKSKFIKNTSNSISTKAIRETNIKLNKKGSLVYSFKLSVGQVAFLEDDMYTNEAVATFDISNKNSLKFLYYMAPIFIIKNSNENIYGAKLLNQNLINNAKILIPILNDQQKIANFLDLKTAEFDSIISKKERLIEKLQEAKKSLISEVVTGKVKIVNGELVEREANEMKDSGVEWLGMIPKDWEMKRLKQVVLEPLKYGANESGDDDNKTNPRYIRITDFGDDGKLKNNTFRSLERKKAKEFMLDEGDILFARSGATVGKTFQFKDYKIEACFAGYLIKATPNNKIVISDFMYFFTKTLNYENWKNSIFIQATIQNIGADKYRELKICLPDIFEQDEICKFLNLKTDKIDSITTKTKLQIQKLKQAKQSLISEAVTGKSDLRDWLIEEI